MLHLNGSFCQSNAILIIIPVKFLFKPSKFNIHMEKQIYKIPKNMLWYKENTKINYKAKIMNIVWH